MSVSALLRMELRRAYGYYVDGEEMHRAVAVRTPFGARVRDTEIAPSKVPPPEEPEATPDEDEVAQPRLAHYIARIRRMFEAINQARIGYAVGLNAGAGYFVALEAERKDEITAGGGSLGAYIEGDKTGSSTVLSDRIEVSVAKTSYLLVAAAQEADVRGLLRHVGTEGARRARCELAAAAALRVAYREVAPKGSAAEIRVWMGERHCIAALSRGRTPLAWDEIPRNHDGWLDALVGAVVRLTTVAVSKIGSGPPTRFILQGPADAETVARLSALMELDLEQSGDRALDAAAIAEGLALGALSSAPALSLARSIQPPPSILLTLPWTETVAMVGATALLGAVLGFQLIALDGQLSMAMIRQQQVEWAQSLSNTQLKIEAKELKKSVTPMSDYLAGGLTWTPLLADIPDTLPLDSWVNAITAEDSLWARKQKKEFGDRYLLISEAAPLGPGGAVPDGVDNALEALRASAVGEYFPIIELTEVQWRREGFTETSGYSIVCQPR